MNDTDTAVYVSIGDICKYTAKVPGRFKERLFVVLEISPTFSWARVLVLIGDSAGTFMPNSVVTIYRALPYLEKI